jgi:hypothetical protein
MSYCCTTITAERSLKATANEYEALHAALEASEEKSGISGLQVEYDHGEVYLFTEDGDYDELSDEVLTLLGAIIAKNGLNYLEFGVAYTCDSPSMGSQGGTYFRVRKDGSLWEPRFKWRCSRRVKRQLKRTRTKPQASSVPERAQGSDISIKPEQQ